MQWLTLYSTANCVHESCLCQDGMKEQQTNNRTWPKGLLLEEGKLAVGGTSIACIVSQYLRFLA